MISRFYGDDVAIEELRPLFTVKKNGVTLLDISEAAKNIGLQTTGAKLTLSRLKQAQLPCILYWRKQHFVVLYKIEGGIFYIADPGIGLVTYNEDELKRRWLINKDLNNGVTLLFNI